VLVRTLLDYREMDGGRTSTLCGSELSAHFDEIFPADVGVKYECGFERRRFHPAG
jgi:hypothetical protein